MARSNVSTAHVQITLDGQSAIREMERLKQKASDLKK